MPDELVVTTYQEGDRLGDDAVSSARKHWPCEVKVIHRPAMLKIPDPPEDEAGRYKDLVDFKRFTFKGSLIANLADYVGSTRYVYWLDADVITFKDIPPGFLSNLFEGHPLVFIGRKNWNAETGFIGFDMESDRTHEFLSVYRSVYESGDVFKLRAWWDGEVFDEACLRLGITDKNLTAGFTGGSGSHPWIKTPLVEFTDHLKGIRRKNYGYSPEHPRSGMRGPARPWMSTYQSSRTPHQRALNLKAKEGK